VMAVLPLSGGLQYYLTPIMERPYSTLYEAYKPSGLVGHGLGILGSLMMIVGVAMYSSRKRISMLRRAGSLRSWLDIHIFLCTLGPFLVTLHTSFKFGGIVSISFWAMVVVVASGVVGRYVYVRIPKTVNGRFIEPSVLLSDKADLAERIETHSGLSAGQVDSILSEFEPESTGGITAALIRSLSFDMRARARVRRLDTRLAGYSISGSVRRKVVLEMENHIQIHHQYAVVRSFRRLFGYWHVLHLPLATLMFLIMFVHVAIAILFGYAWLVQID